MKLSRTSLFIMIALTLFSLSAASSLAEKPNRPDVWGAWLSQTNYFACELYAQLQVDDLSNVDGIKIYMSTDSMDFSSATLIKTVDFSNTQDSVYFYGDSSMNLISTIVGLESPGVYAFYFVAYNGDGDSDPTRGVVCYLRSASDPTITIHNEPVTNTYVGGQYAWDIDASMSDNSPVAYRLNYSPEGMTIDSQTGLISWTPSASGTFYVQAEAWSVDHPSINQNKNWYIRVLNCQTPGIIIANVVDEDGNKIEFGMGTLYSARPDSIMYGDSVLYTDSLVEVNAGRISEGFMVICGIDQGTYYLNLYGYNNFESEWYLDAGSFDNSTPITVNCGDTVVLNITVKATVPPVYHSITGTITDAETGLPVNYVAVTLFRKDDNGVYNRVHGAFSYYGSYSFNGVEPGTYIVACNLDTSYYSQNYYYPQFWDNASDISLATEIVLSSNLDSINFHLVPKPVYNNGIIGTVRSTDNVALTDIFITAYSLSGGDSLFYSNSYSSMSIDQGEFSLTNLNPGTYILFASPLRSDAYVSGYYYQDMPVVQAWQDATILTVAESGFIGPVTITLPLKQMVDGSGEVSGRVSSDGGKFKTGGDLPQSATPVIGANLYLLDNNGLVTKYITSDKNGDYSLKNLPVGIYTFVADRFGFSRFSQSIEIKADNPTVKQSVVLDKVTTGIDKEVIANTDINIFPNPASWTMNVSINAKAGLASLTIVNFTGSEVSSSDIELIDGMNNITIDTRTIATGVYCLRISRGGNVATIPFVVVR